MAGANEDLKGFLKDFLKKNGYRIKTTVTASETLLALDQFSPDLVILDQDLQDVSGESVCWSIRNEQTQLPIIMMVQEKALDEEVRCFKGGVDDFITKPIDSEELLLRVENAVNHQDYVDDKLRAGDLVLDLKTHQVRLGDRAIDLTPKEFKLLKYLLQNKGRVLSRAVDVYIGYLRKKLDQGLEESLIKTVRGFGYMIEEN